MSSEIPRKYMLILAGWTLLVFASLAWNILELQSNTLSTAAAAARSSLAKDIGVHYWASSHGGVYVPVVDGVEPNPYLQVPERDVTTMSGKKLTLINPAHVLREVRQKFSSSTGVRSNLTSLKLSNPGNAPDRWEAEALASFDRGAVEALEVSSFNDRPHLRFMLPMPVTGDCLKCHSGQNYTVGDIRGGIGAYVDLQPYLAVEHKRRYELMFSHSLIWLAGLLGLCAAFRRESDSVEQQEKSNDALLKLSQALEQNSSLILITDLAKNIEYVNAAYLQATGYTRADVIGRNPDIFRSTVAQRDAATSVWSLVRSGTSWEGQGVGTRKDGSEYIEHEKISPLRDAKGRIAHFLVVKEDITLRKAAEDEIRHLAFYDHLTQLPNRRLMLDRLKQALAASARHGRHGALMMIDLDNFKSMNDTLGHAVGDQLLIEAADRLKSCLREGDTVARLGGDEFVVILEDLESNERAVVQSEVVACKINVSLGKPYRFEVPTDSGKLTERSHVCTSSIGITLFFDQATSIDELMRRADTAMYQAKAAGRNTFRYFDAEMQSKVSARAALEVDLRKAIVDEQFLLHYQAQVDSRGGVIGAEALVRWQHPERGLVSPGEFIPLAEDTGLILPIGHWVLATACAQIARWAQQPDTMHFTVSVNVSARQFSLPNFVEEVKSVLEQTGATPTRLKLELTESVLLHKTEDIVAKMMALKAIGVSFSLDDFGTGYSSLSYLKRLPIDELKIDQSFVRDILTDPNDAAIAKTVVALGQILGLAVIAEGVETEGQRDFLARFGCDAYQGYLFSRPLAIRHFEEFVQRRANRAEPAAVGQPSNTPWPSLRLA